LSHPTHEHVRLSSKESAVAFLQVISPHRNHYEIHTLSRGHGGEMKKSPLFAVSLTFILGFIGADAYAATPKAGTAAYVAKDKKNLRHLVAFEGCANPTHATAKVQVLVNGKWLTVKPIKTGWKISPDACPVAQLGKKNSLAWADVYLDGGVTFRWYFKGNEVNILHRDYLGNGYSESASFIAPAPLVTPHPVDNKYGITWQNITSRVKDISAAAYTDAQATIARNQGLPSAADGFKTYISPGAARMYPAVTNGPNLMKRTFSLFAKYPHSKKNFYIATTMEEIKETFAKIDTLYPSSPFMKNTYDGMFGINTNLPAGSVYTHAKCEGGDSGRNTSDWTNVMVASAVVWNFCDRNNPRDHIESDHGAPHEHIHNVQGQIFDRKQIELQPCWMKEGEAEWAQTAASETFTEYLDLQHFHPYYVSSNGLNYRQLTQTTWTPSELDEYFKEAVVMPCNTTPRQAMSYSAGAAAIEALVAISGSESFFAVDQRIANGKKFVDAFKEVYGVTWDYAEAILADVVAQKLTLAQSQNALTYQTRP
jgi:hypothetical protein